MADKNYKPFISGSIQEMRDKVNNTPINAIDNINHTEQPAPRYKNLDELRSEFGTYRVNNKTVNISEPDATPAKYMVSNDPYIKQANNQ